MSDGYTVMYTIGGI